ncbi:hypothetical protein [Photobacterium leiognathi]|uniref:hypothetical protein n=1 Tax=Photobacterium leiognathi TaxID=553611 RepID=UPI002980DE4D|nr:hypothetical protein [Photobacterium leiognathi]
MTDPLTADSINAKRKSRSSLVIIAVSFVLMIASNLLHQYLYGISAPVTDIKDIITTLTIVGIASGFLAMYSTLPLTYPEDEKVSIELLMLVLSFLVSLFSYCFIKVFVM